MKHMKKFTAMLLAVIMVLGMAMSASAASITIDGGAENSKYAAYRLLKAELPTEDDTSGTYNFTVNEKYLDVLKEVTAKETDKDIVEYIEALDAAGVRAFADAVYAKIKGMTADYTAVENVFDDVEMGYYLIAETELGDKSDTYSLIMLDTAAANNDASITITTKEDKPTVDKEVEEVNDTTGNSGVWGESADYDIGDTISYRITGTVSNKYANYASYYYSFSDSMDSGLTLNQDSIKITVNGIDITESFTITKQDHEFVASSNLKEITTGKDSEGMDVDVSIDADDEIIVTYTATLNENAVSGETGNKNEVVLKYENNPYHEGNGDGDPTTPDEPETPGETPKDVNVVFTYDAIVNKTDEDGNALEGAGFTLYKWSKEKNDWDEVKEIKGKTIFTFEGLDVGKYKLVETTVPNGYNKADDIEFEVVATYDIDKDPVELTGLEVKDAEGNVISGENLIFTAEKTTGEMETDVINVAGIALPESGGIGTTIFYIAGAALVLAAVVMLVTKRRMKAE